MRYKKVKYRLSILLMAGALFLGSTSQMVSFAQEDQYILAHESIFGQLRRSPVMFSHARHEEVLGDEGCGTCHHAQDEESGQLVYVEGEELSCWECHGREKENQTPTLQGAYHGSCTACHRESKKQDKPASGPTTCGECHAKQ